MDSIFLHLQNFNLVSYGAFGIVLMSFIIEAKSNSPYKSLLISNIGFGIYNFSLLTVSEIDFPIYFILLSFLICSWFFVLKNIEEEEDENRGYLRDYHNISIASFNDTDDEKKNINPSLADNTLFRFLSVLSKKSSGVSENKFFLYVAQLLENDVIYYKHPQRKLVQIFTYILLTSILVSFFYI
ncbi:hypothetical protein BC952_2122 [Flavobacterium limicola]|uniref:Uncharacterized protein n=1 Tax=Flavobacterium limicola TaxID=180441 RepID=A0A495S3L2_9FLAO|nr:hypothetical protein [Flavobacterium limicola]RKS94250.1 hypothetical protein BC952_2122 [Flavobacterium limicola]